MEKIATTTNGMKRTPLGRSYWHETGFYQGGYDLLYAQLVPDSGNAPTIHGEMIRCVGRLFYDFCNNGNCNAVDVKMEECHQCGGSGYEEVYNEDEDQWENEDCHWCDGSGEDEGETFVTDYYQEMLDFLYEFLKDNKCVGKLEDFMLKGAGYGKYKFDDKEMDIYNHVVDCVVYQCLNTQNNPNPYHKTK